MTAQLPDRPIVIIEDSDEDYHVLVWALRQAAVANPLYRCGTAGEIVGLMADRSHWPAMLTAAYPLLILMDLNIPGTDWHETLGAFRSNVLWGTVPVVIVSTSIQPASVATCYRLGACGYMQKPLDLDAYADKIKGFADYWLKSVVLPAA